MPYAEKPGQGARSMAVAAAPAVLVAAAGMAAMLDGFGYTFGRPLFWVAMGALLLGMSVAFLTRTPRSPD